jgi:parallel beta-helix repeat protein
MKTRMLLAGLMAGLLAITSRVFAVHVDGYCYLEGQSNHEGTRVLFEAITPTAEDDSAFTDLTGFYQADLNVGVYDVFISHYGYSNADFQDQLISVPMTFPEVTLMDVPDGIYISGDLSGVLEDTVYIVEGTIHVSYGASLSIEPGAVFYFLGTGSVIYGFYVEGVIIAVGTETDTIKFMPAPGSPGWGGIGIYSDQSDSRLVYCYVTGANGPGIRAQSPYATIDLTISHCTVVGNSPLSRGAIDCQNTDAVITHCKVNGNSGYGIYLEDVSSPTISHCVISENTQSGIYCTHWAYADINYCVMESNGQHGINVGGTYAHCDPLINHCTVAGNVSNGINISAQSDPIIVNTIVWGSGDGGIYFDNGSQESSLSYSNIFNNVGGDLTGDPPDFLGTVVATNINGDSCDVFYNIFMDPLFVNPGNGVYYLQSTSPCIDAGDPETPPDPNGSLPDMGAFYYDPMGVEEKVVDRIVPTAFRLYSNYPNPFNPLTTISVALPIASPVQLLVYDIMGHRVVTLLNEWRDVGTHRVTFNGSLLASGIYFCKIQAGEFSAVKKMVLLK